MRLVDTGHWGLSRLRTVGCYDFRASQVELGATQIER